MIYATIIGILLLAVSYMMFFTTNQVFEELIKSYGFLIGIVGGIGIGFIIGGFLGWLFKYRKLAKEKSESENQQDKV